MCKLPHGRDWWWEKLSLALLVSALLSKVLIQLSADERGSTSSLVAVWPEVTQRWGLWLYGRVNGDPTRGFTARRTFLA